MRKEVSRETVRFHSICASIVHCAEDTECTRSVQQRIASTTIANALWLFFRAQIVHYLHTSENVLILDYNNTAMELYNPVAKSVDASIAYPDDVKLSEGFAAASLGYLVVVTGGRGNVNMMLYEPTSNNWTLEFNGTVLPGPTQRYFHASVATKQVQKCNRHSRDLLQMIYVFGGVDSDGKVMSSAQFLDVRTNSSSDLPQNYIITLFEVSARGWQSMPNMTARAKAQALTMIDSKGDQLLVVFGGAVDGAKKVK